MRAILVWAAMCTICLPRELAAEPPDGSLTGGSSGPSRRESFFRAALEHSITAYSARTDSTGCYFFEGILAGQYDLSVTAPGFASYRAHILFLNAEQALVEAKQL